ncbi:unnamed protein product [Owenia fusiformis]|uniref:Uncharacterized protein n=1 Tax=Owenia fusiformis TaxID=6347 RepID=A0A8S4NPR9_OWEFU|nr:unnamed protein product [Owenia fusiformis]
MALVPWTYNNPRIQRSNCREQTYTFCNKNVTVYQDTEKEINVHNNTAFKMWDGSFLLAKYLENKCLGDRTNSFLKKKNCIELGAGCGLVGIVTWLLGANVTLTDMDTVVSFTENCVAKNIGHLTEEHAELNANINVMELTWGKKDLDDSRFCAYDIILGSDIVYSPDIKLNEMLISTMESLWKEDTVFILSYKPRSLGENIFFDMLSERNFATHTIPSTQHPKEFSGSDYSIFHITR